MTRLALGLLALFVLAAANRIWIIGTLMEPVPGHPRLQLYMVLAGGALGVLSALLALMLLVDRSRPSRRYLPWLAGLALAVVAAEITLRSLGA
jgi:hypothetical protein